MEKKTVATLEAPSAIGPYSQAVIAGDFVFVSGQIPLDPESGKLVAGSIKEQTERVLRNLKAIIEAAGSSMEKVIKTTVYLVDLAEFKEFNETYAKFFPENPPARATVEVANLPAGARVEIEAIALR